MHLSVFLWGEANLEPIAQSEISQKEKQLFIILTPEIWCLEDSTDETIFWEYQMGADIEEQTYGHRWVERKVGWMESAMETYTLMYVNRYQNLL